MGGDRWRPSVLELEADDAERINSTSTRAAVAELTGEVRTTHLILTSLDRLTEAGVLESSKVEDWRGGHDWQTTERGRRIAEAFVGEWGRVLEIGDTSTNSDVDAPFITTPREARRHYSKRFGIEASYRLATQSLAMTSSRDAGLHLLLFVMSLLLQNVWRYLHWLYVAAPRRGGRRLWRWPFTEFCEMVTRGVWTALGVRRAVPANRPLDDWFRR